MTYEFTGSEGNIGGIALKRGDRISLDLEAYENAVAGGASLTPVLPTIAEMSGSVNFEPAKAEQE